MIRRKSRAVACFNGICKNALGTGVRESYPYLSMSHLRRREAFHRDDFEEASCALLAKANLPSAYMIALDGCRRHDVGCGRSCCQRLSDKFRVGCEREKVCRLVDQGMRDHVGVLHALSTFVGTCLCNHHQCSQRSRLRSTTMDIGWHTSFPSCPDRRSRRV